MSIPVNEDKAGTFITKCCGACSVEFKSWQCLNQKYCSNNCRHQGRKAATAKITEKICTSCNNLLPMHKFTIKSRGYRESMCISCVLLHRRTSPKSIFSAYKSSAKTRKGLAANFELTYEQFILLWQKPCSYCDEEIPTIGLDRVDSSLGYTLANVVPCCWVCNAAKSNLTVDQFVSHCFKIVGKWSSKNGRLNVI